MRPSHFNKVHTKDQNLLRTLIRVDSQILDPNSINQQLMCWLLFLTGQLAAAACEETASYKDLICRVHSVILFNFSIKERNFNYSSFCIVSSKNLSGNMNNLFLRPVILLNFSFVVIFFFFWRGDQIRDYPEIN